MEVRDHEQSFDTKNEGRTVAQAEKAEENLPFKSNRTTQAEKADGKSVEADENLHFKSMDDENTHG
eukprot:7604553-Heterocapsa_arctica.AAC.1